MARATLGSGGREAVGVRVSPLAQDVVSGRRVAEYEARWLQRSAPVAQDSRVNVPVTRYAKSQDGAHIAYQVFGAGDVDLLWISPWLSHVEVVWEWPPIAHFHEQMASFARVITFDQRGIGLSDRTKGLPDLETRMDDLRAVLDAAGSDRTVLWGGGADGGALCAMFAATHPERVIALAFWNAVARTSPAPDYAWGMPRETMDAFSLMEEQNWGQEKYAAEIARMAGAPSVAETPAGIAWVAKAMRYMAAPGDVLAFDEMWNTIDFRSILPSIHVPTVVMHSWEGADREETSYLVTRITAAKEVALPPDGHHPMWPNNTEAAVGALRRFIEEVREEEADLDRVLSTVMFTDIVDSTATAAVVGDRRWRELVEQHHGAVRALLGRFRGKEIDTAGDGFFATFDGPARGVRCAQAIGGAVRDLGVEVRAGVHTGEVETMAGKVGGIAVNVGARIASLAGPSEVLVSSTVRDLVSGSGLTFEDAGEHELKGVPDRWHLYRAVSERT